MQLEKIIEQAYILFDKYSVSLPLNACTHCCLEPADEARLAALPVAQIPFKLLYDYNTAAKAGNTPVEEIKHFLPRMLELMTQFEFVYHSEALTLCRLSPFNAKEWTTEELTLLKHFEAQFFLKTLKNPKKVTALDILLLFHRADRNIEPLLKIWEKQADVNSVIQFKNFWLYNINEVRKSNLIGAFADEPVSELIRNWAMQTSVKQHFKQQIEQIIVENKKVSKKDLEQLNWTYELLT